MFIELRKNHSNSVRSEDLDTCLCEENTEIEYRVKRAIPPSTKILGGNNVTDYRAVEWQVIKMINVSTFGWELVEEK